MFLTVYGKLTEADDVEAVPLDCDSPTASEFGTRVAQYIKNVSSFETGSYFLKCKKISVLKMRAVTAVTH